MSNQKTVRIDLKGSVPSKKNSRVRTRSGHSIPSKAFYEWQEYAIMQVKQQCHEMFLTPVNIDVTIIFGTKARADLDNRLTSILDMLVEAIVIRDDKWQDVPSMSAKAEYVKGEPGAIIKITEVSAII